MKDFSSADIEHTIHWQLIETEWLEWDAPWELEEEISFNPEQYRINMINMLSEQLDPDRIRYRFQIYLNHEDNKCIGWINAYRIDDDFCWTNDPRNITIGISIADLNSRRKGYATEAWSLYVNYLLNNKIHDIYSQTWSGNLRIIGLMEKIGFVGSKEGLSNSKRKII